MDQTVDALQRLSGSGLLDEITESIKKRALPNIFRVFPRVLRAESLHSDVLRWLLDPREWHGLGDSFSGEFLRRALKQSQEGTVPDDLRSEAQIIIDEAHTEIPVGGGIIDILVRGRWGDSSFVLGIENKIDASEGRKGKGEEKVGQLQLYAEALRRLYPESTVFVALLTPDGRRPWRPPAEVRWASLRYEDIAAPLDTVLRTPAALDPRVAASVGRALADHYISIIWSHVMGKDDEVTKKCWALYKEYPDAWRAIRARLPSERDEAHRLLGQASCRLFKQHFGGDWTAAVRDDKYATLSRPEWRTAFGDWSGGPLVSFEEGVDPPVIPAIHFRLALEVGDDDQPQAPPTLAVRIKFDLRPLRRKDAGRQKSLIAELREVFGEVKGMDAGQFTIGLGRRRLKRAGPVQEVSDHVAGLAAEAVFEWFGDEVSKAIKVVARASGSVEVRASE